MRIVFLFVVVSSSTSATRKTEVKKFADISWKDISGFLKKRGDEFPKYFSSKHVGKISTYWGSELRVLEQAGIATNSLDDINTKWEKASNIAKKLSNRVFQADGKFKAAIRLLTALQVVRER